MPTPVDELILFSGTTGKHNHQKQATQYVFEFIQNQ
jgi:hypothetical protein